MEIHKVQIMQLKDEYVKTFEGQNKLENIVEDNIHFDEKVEFEEDSSLLTVIAIQCAYFNLYSGEDNKEKLMFHDLYLGSEEFQYTFSRWELEMKIKNPTKEQIAEHIVNSWFYEISPDDTEEIEDIAISQEYGFHDNIFLKIVPADRVKEIYKNISKEKIMSIGKSLEKELNSCGVNISDGEDEIDDMELLDDIINIFKKAVEENTAVLYALTEW